VVATFGPDGITGHPDHIRIGEAATSAFLRFAGDGGPGFRRLVYGGIRQSVIDRWNSRRVRAGLTPWNPNTVYHLRGVPDDMNNPESTLEQRVRSVSRETEVIAWPKRPGRLLRDTFEDL
jgi:LmbE family N-acetylglucosaminyl deacetylase